MDYTEYPVYVPLVSSARDSHNPKKKLLKWPASLEIPRDSGTIPRGAANRQRTCSDISGSGRKADLLQLNRHWRSLLIEPIGEPKRKLPSATERKNRRRSGLEALEGGAGKRL